MTLTEVAGIILVCPACRGPIDTRISERLSCRRCGSTYVVASEIPVFLSPEEYRRSVLALRDEQAVWDRYSAARRMSPLTSMYYDWWVARLLADVPAHLTGPVLELMSGGVEVGRRLPARFTALVAFDLNVPALQQAHAALTHAGETRVVAVGGSADRLPFPDRSLPVVVIQGGLHHVRPILPSVLNEVARVLTEDGVLVASEPCNDNAVIRRIRGWQYTRSPMHGASEEGFRRQELNGFLKAAGLRITRYRRFGFIAYPFMGNTDLIPLLARSSATSLGRMLLRLDDVLAHTPVLRRFAFASLFTATREDATTT